MVPVNILMTSVEMLLSCDHGVKHVVLLCGLLSCEVAFNCGFELVAICESRSKCRVLIGAPVIVE